MERYFHVRDPQRPRGGATVRVVGGEGKTSVEVQVAYCSINDQFCRTTGRERANATSSRKVPLDQLPNLLHKVAKKVVRRYPYMGDRAALNPNWRQTHELFNRDFSFATKYFKEKTD